MTLVNTLSDLRAELRDGTLTEDPDVLAAHRVDRAMFCPSGLPIGLVRARSVRDVVATLQWANRTMTPVVPQGARSGLSGAANAIDGCVLLSLEKMDRIQRIDPAERIAIVEPGVINASLSSEAAHHGLYYPPDPGSRDISTIGGNVSTNAGGMCCVKYGVTRDFVRGLQVVLADGQVMRTGRSTAKGVAGYDLTGLLVGAEGTLGIVTEVTLSLRPVTGRPLTGVAFFRNATEACRVVAGYLAAGYRPSVLEFMDDNTIHAVNRLCDLGFPDATGAMLLVQSDADALAPTELRAFEQVARDHCAMEVVIAEDAAEGESLMRARRLVGDANEQLGTTLIDDVCVPLGRLVDLLDGVRRIADRHQVLITCAGHAGDGNMHPCVIFDANDAAEVLRAEAAFHDVMGLGLELGGTITGEHGVGQLKRNWLGRELDAPALWAQRQIKTALDPNNILNPGRVLPFE